MEHLITSQSRVKLIKFFLKNDVGYGRGIELSEDIPHNCVVREIKILESSGMIHFLTEKEGKKYYGLNDKCHLIKPLANIFNIKLKK